MEYTQGQLPSEIFNAGSGETRNFNGQDVKVINTGRGTRVLQPLTQDDIISQATKRNQEAIQPAVRSYEASRPEVQAGFNKTRETLNDRYSSLLSSIKQQGEQDVNQQTRITNTELGKRGLNTNTDTVAAQEVQNAVSPLRQKYAGLEKDTAISQNQQLGNLTTEEAAAMRAITQAIANLQAGAGQTGIAQGLSQYNTNTQNFLSGEQIKADSKAKEVANAIAQAQLALEKQKTDYETGKPYYKPESVSSTEGLDFSALMGLLGGSSGSTKPTFKPF